MTRQTSLHGWTVPTEGDENYEDTFDDFFVDLDTNGEIRDVESNLQNYSPKSGAKFVATDTENRYIGDGSTWNKVASSGKNPNFDSVNTGDATVTNSPATADDVLRFQEGAEVGEVLIDGLDNSGADDGWGSSTATNANVSFDSAFNNTPYIQLTIDTNTSQVNGDEWLCTINNPTTTGFDVTVFQMAANDNSGITDAYAVEYQATEGR